MKKGIVKNEGVLFIIKFLCLFTFLYYFNLFFISITSKEDNTLYVFLKQNLDYIDWLRYSLLHTSNYFSNIIGIKCFVINEYVILLDSGKGSLRMVYKCVGYGVMSFWAAFVIANKATFFRKTFWVIVGWFALWVINCIRILLLLAAIENRWPKNRYLDHHSMFNIVAYSFIFILIYIYTRSSKAETK